MCYWVLQRDHLATHLFERFINHTRMLKVIVGEEVELIEKVSDVDTAERIHLREWEHTREAERSVMSMDASPARHSLEFFTIFVW